MKILITGGAGFVGSSLAYLFKEEFPEARIFCLDNLRRRGSELNLRLMKERGIQFVHGDIRQSSDLFDLNKNFDIMIEASAEPSVHAGTQNDPTYVLQTNLLGSMNCFEFARMHVDRSIFLSTSRVYSIAPLCALPFEECASRLEPRFPINVPGWSEQGVSESFCVSKAKSLYGATKLASELIALEYCDTYRSKIIINRCGVIAGPGQFGKVDQGVFTLWVAHHYFGRPLGFKGFGGMGLQVRDLLHPRDLYRVIKQQLETAESCAGEVFNIGGGRDISTSLKEFTQVCESVVGRSVDMKSEPETNRLDIPYYVSDTEKARTRFDWQAKTSVPEIVREIHEWIQKNEQDLKPLFCS